MPNYKYILGLYVLWFHLYFYDGVSGLRLNHVPGTKLELVGQCLMFVFGWAIDSAVVTAQFC